MSENPNTPDPNPRTSRSDDEDALGFRNVDEDATHDESPGGQGEHDAPPQPPSAA
jgi:hypothetical protein